MILSGTILIDCVMCMDCWSVVYLIIYFIKNITTSFFFFLSKYQFRSIFLGSSSIISDTKALRRSSLNTRPIAYVSAHLLGSLGN